MKTTFSINHYDRDGDLVDTGIYLHLESGIILTFKDVEELKDFGSGIVDMISEIIDTVGNH